MSIRLNLRYLAADATQSVWKTTQILAPPAWVLAGGIRAPGRLLPKLCLTSGKCALFGIAGCHRCLRQCPESQAYPVNQGHHLNQGCLRQVRSDELVRNVWPSYLTEIAACQ